MYSYHRCPNKSPNTLGKMLFWFRLTIYSDLFRAASVLPAGEGTGLLHLNWNKIEKKTHYKQYSAISVFPGLKTEIIRMYSESFIMDCFDYLNSWCVLVHCCANIHSLCYWWILNDRTHLLILFKIGTQDQRGLLGHQVSAVVAGDHIIPW